MIPRHGWPVVAALAVTVTACASTPRGPRAAASCEAVPVDFWPGGPEVFRDCAVNQRARPIGTPVRIQYTPSGSQPCRRAVFELVVDSAGKTVPETARLVRTDDKGFADAVQSILGQLRYEPARKEGRRVAQLVRVEHTLAMRVVVVPAGTPPSAAASGMARAPSC